MQIPAQIDWIVGGSLIGAGVVWGVAALWWRALSTAVEATIIDSQPYLKADMPAQSYDLRFVLGSGGEQATTIISGTDLAMIHAKVVPIRYLKKDPRWAVRETWLRGTTFGPVLFALGTIVIFMSGLR